MNNEDKILEMRTCTEADITGRGADTSGIRQEQAAMRETIDEMKETLDEHTIALNALIGTGRISTKDRIEIVEKSANGNDYARVGLYAYHGRKKTPFVYWNLCVDVARKIIHWDTSTFYHL